MTAEGDDWFPLAELAQRLAQLVWVEEHLAAVLERWASVEPHAGTAIVYASAAGHHRWHGEVLRSCLPTSEQLSEPSTPHPPTTGWAQAFETLNALDADEDSGARLLSLVREINPWLARETAALLDVSRPIADAALIRLLGFVEVDHDRDGGHMAALSNSLRENTVSLRDRAVISSLDLGVPRTAD